MSIKIAAVSLGLSFCLFVYAKTGVEVYGRPPLPAAAQTSETKLVDSRPPKKPHEVKTILSSDFQGKEEKVTCWFAIIKSVSSKPSEASI